MKFEDTNTQPATLLERYDYTYTGLNAAYCRVEANAAARYDYTFDKLRRLTQERKRGTGGGTPLHYQKDFTYDRAGNRTSYRHQNGPGFNYGAAANYDSYTQDTGRRYARAAMAAACWPLIAASPASPAPPAARCSHPAGRAFSRPPR